MAIAVGYFLPDSASDMSGLRRPPKHANHRWISLTLLKASIFVFFC